VTDELVEPAQWLALPDVADGLGVPITTVHQMIRDRVLLAERRDGILRIPVEMVAGETVLKHLPGVLTVLFDGGYSDKEAFRWLYTTDDTLPGVPITALNGDLAREVKRRAQALAF
jgi:type VI protein secretion system component VasK